MEHRQVEMQANVATLKLIPRFSWILLERPEVNEKTENGLFLPTSVVEQKQKFANYGTILEMGEDVNHDRFQVGMLVVFAASGGYTVKVQGETYFFVLESDIIASDWNVEPKVEFPFIKCGCTAVYDISTHYYCPNCGVKK